MKLSSALPGISILLYFLFYPLPGIAGTTAAQEFLLLYSNNVNGEIEPCG
ncbi:MAG: hypothetical protein R6W72_04145 [Desulfurivibrionaceae bacterium]